MGEPANPSESETLTPEEERQLAALISQLFEKWKAMPRETRLELLSSANTAFALFSTINLNSISESTESLAKSSETLVGLTQALTTSSKDLVVFTKRLAWLTGFLIAETAVLIGLTVFLVLR